MPEWWVVLLLVVAGVVAGVVNTVAGGGSLLTMPILIFLGLPAVTANGTNRLAVLLQNATASWSFGRAGLLERSVAWRVGVAAAAGGLLGTAAAIAAGDQLFQRMLAWIMMAVAVWTLIDGAVRRRATAAKSRPGLILPGFFVAGVYAGFVQVGVGFLLLAVTTIAGFDLVRGNALKVFSVLCVSVLSLALFAWQGRVDWPLGLALAVGNAFGGWVGARLTVLKGHAWVERVVLITAILFALQLLVRS